MSIIKLTLAALQVKKDRKNNKQKFAKMMFDRFNKVKSK